MLAGMIRSALLVSAALCLANAPARADLTRQECASHAAGLAPSVQALQKLLTATEAMDLAATAKKATGETRAAFERFDQARRRFVPALRELNEATQDLQYRLLVCSR